MNFSDTPQQEHLLYLMDITYLCLQFCLGASKGDLNDFWINLKKMNLFFHMRSIFSRYSIYLSPHHRRMCFLHLVDLFSTYTIKNKGRDPLFVEFSYCNFKSSLLEMRNKLYSIFDISYKCLNSRTQLGLCPTAGHS